MKTMTADELGITPHQLENLNRLLVYAKTHLDTPFDINWFAHEPTKQGEGNLSIVKPAHPCGTTVCFAGMGPLAGITPRENETWETYITRELAPAIGEQDDIYALLFSCDHENSLPAAIARLEFFLTSGYPDTNDLPTWEVSHLDD